MRIIGFGHKSRVGKDTCVTLLTQELKRRGQRVVRLSFADLLKEAAYTSFKWAGLMPGVYYENNPDKRLVVLPKIGKTPVQLWIEFGNKVRDIYQDNWLEAAASQVGPDGWFLFSDVRFPNEGNRLVDAGGRVYRVDNPNVVPLNSVSDNALNDWTRWSGIIDNVGTISELNDKVIRLLDA